jgi:hypothetical protein
LVGLQKVIDENTRGGRVPNIASGTLQVESKIRWCTTFTASARIECLQLSLGNSALQSLGGRHQDINMVSDLVLQTG